MTRFAWIERNQSEQLPPPHVSFGIGILIPALTSFSGGSSVPFSLDLRLISVFVEWTEGPRRVKKRKLSGTFVRGPRCADGCKDYVTVLLM